MTANNYALKFTKASKDRVDIAGAALAGSIRNLSAFTLEAMIKPGANAEESSARIYLERQGTGKYPRLSLSAWNNYAQKVGRLRFEFSRVDGKADTNYMYTLHSLWDDYWHHVAFVVDIGNKKYEIYFDGAMVVTGSVPDGGKDGGNNALKVSDTAPLGIYLGAGYDGTTYSYWDGKVDDIRIWKSALAQNTISNARFDHIASPGSESNLIEEWRINEGTGTTTVGAKNASWSGTLRRNGAASSALWTTDRPFMGDGNQDENPPSNITMNAPTNKKSSGFDLSWTASTDDVYVQYYELTIATDSAFNSPVAGYAALNVGLALNKKITGLAPATNYYARVRALDAALNASDYATYSSNAAITTLSVGDITPPVAPVALAASAITDTSFQANWNPSSSGDTTGYKLDVATDAAFTNFLPSYRNLDVGSALSKTITVGVNPSTTYFYRVRAYDAAQNESIESNAIEITTAAPPDTTPPDPVVLMPATSIASTSFTANWNVGVDNVGVAGYRLSVATDENFTTFVPGFTNLDVGNVTSYGVAGLAPSTGYWYRVRAYDAAGNIGGWSLEPEQAPTTPSLVDEGGLLEITFDPNADTYVAQGASTTNYGGSASLSVDNSVKRAYLKFDLSELTGTLVNANLNLYVTDPTTATITLKRVQSGTWSESALTYATDALTFAAEQVTVVPSNTGWTTVDVASLLTAGFVEYTIALTSNGSDLLVFDSKEGANIPHLTVEIDPTSSTELQSGAASANNLDVINLLKNPSAETGGPSFGGATGITALTSATLTQDNTKAFDGSNSVKVVSAASSGSGVKFESNAALAIAGTGQTIRGAVHLTANSSLSVTAKLRLIYTDASTTDGPTITCPLNTDWRKFRLTAVATNGKTVDKVELHVLQADTTIRTYWADAAVASAGVAVALSFNGGTSPDTDWDGAANASTSTFEGATITGVVTYVGDGNGDNSATVAYKRAADNDFIRLDALAPSINRGTKKVTATVGPFYEGNRLFNPSFTQNANHWVANAIGMALTRIDTDGMEEEGSSDRACLSVAGNGSIANQGARVSHLTQTATGEDWAASFYLKSVSGATALRLVIEERDSSGNVLTSGTADVTITANWERYFITRKLTHASAAFVTVSVINPAATAASWLLDWAQLERNSVVTPYHDGDSADGEWEGARYASASYRVLRHEVAYDLRFTFSDVDGVVGSNPFSVQAETPHVPDDVLTVSDLTLSPSNTAIDVVASYLGDDNKSATAVVEWKRADLPTWSKIAHTWNRDKRFLSTSISNLKPGTRYDVRVSFTDTDDGVYGPNPIQSSVTTAIEGLTAQVRTSITFGGFVLMGQDDHYVGVTEHDAFSLPDRRTQVEDLPRTDGAAELSDWWGRRKIRMRGFLHGESRADLNDKVREFRKALAPRQQRLVIDTLDARGFYFTATCTSLGISEVGGETITHVLWDAEFTCADPFRYENEETAESDIALNSGESVTITNSGDLRIEPIFTISTASASSIALSLTNVSTGERIKPAGTITAGDKLVIDSSKRSVRKNGVEIDYAGSFPSLAVGQNTLKVNLSTGSITVSIRRRHKFF